MSSCAPNVRTQLAEARAAYHNLMTGKMPLVVVDQNGERVEFSRANRGDLYRYIQELESRMPGVTTISNGPLGFTF